MPPPSCITLAHVLGPRTGITGTMCDDSNCQRPPRHKHTARPSQSPNAPHQPTARRVSPPDAAAVKLHHTCARLGTKDRQLQASTFTTQTAERPLRRSPQPHLPTYPPPTSSAPHTTPQRDAPKYAKVLRAYRFELELRLGCDSGGRRAEQLSVGGGHSDGARPQRSPARRSALRPHAAQRTEVCEGVASPPHRA